MEPENNDQLQEENDGEEIRMSNFSMVISIVFVTLVLLFLFVKIMFD